MEKKLYRSENDKVLAGVCGGIAEYTGIDSTIIRLIWVLFGFISIGLIAYIIAALIIPQAPYGYYQNQANYNPNMNQNYNNQGNFNQNYQAQNNYQNQANYQGQNMYQNQANYQGQNAYQNSTVYGENNQAANHQGPNYTYQNTSYANNQESSASYAEESKAQEKIYDVENFEETKKSE